MNKRRLFEYGTAAIIIGCITPSIYKMYENTFNKNEGRYSLSIEDLMGTVDDDEEIEEDE